MDIEDVRNPNAIKDVLLAALEDENVGIREVVAGNPSAPEVVLIKALEDKDELVWAAAVKHPNFTPELAAKAAVTANTHDVLQVVAGREDIDNTSRVIATLRDPGNYLELHGFTTSRWL